LTTQERLLDALTSKPSVVNAKSKQDTEEADAALIISVSEISDFGQNMVSETPRQESSSVK